MAQGVAAGTELGLRALHAAAVLGAGGVGLLTLLAPRLAGQAVFAGSATVDPYLRILGALWLALGLVAALGLVQPVRFAPVLLVQLVYKSAWLAVVAYPALLAGGREPGLVILAALFTVWVAALLALLPLRDLLDV